MLPRATGKIRFRAQSDVFHGNQSCVFVGLFCFFWATSPQQEAYNLLHDRNLPKSFVQTARSISSSLQGRQGAKEERNRVDKSIQQSSPNRNKKNPASIDTLVHRLIQNSADRPVAFQFRAVTWPTQTLMSQHFPSWQTIIYFKMTEQYLTVILKPNTIAHRATKKKKKKHWILIGIGEWMRTPASTLGLFSRCSQHNRNPLILCGKQTRRKCKTQRMASKW